MPTSGALFRQEAIEFQQHHRQWGDVAALPCNAMKNLFRPEAVAHSTRRLAGEVLLAAPLPAKLIGLFLSAIGLAALAFAAFATYARTASLSGWLVPNKGLIRAAAPATGVIQSILVSEGEIVPQGKHLAEIALGAETPRAMPESAMPAA